MVVMVWWCGGSDGRGICDGGGGGDSGDDELVLKRIVITAVNFHSRRPLSDQFAA